MKTENINNSIDNLSDFCREVEKFTESGDILLNNSESILKRYSGEDWRKFIDFDEISYKRNLIHKGDNFDIFLICWNENCESPIHDHAQNGCIMRVIEGNLREKIFDKDFKLIKDREICQNQIEYIHNDIGYHKIINETSQKVHTIHIYSPPDYKTIKF